MLDPFAPMTAGRASVLIRSRALVVAVVVTFNRRELLVRCLEALAAQTRPAVRVVVVDNASTDGTLEHLEASGVADRLEVDYVRLRPDHHK